MNPVTHTGNIKAQNIYLLPIILIIGYILMPNEVYDPEDETDPDEIAQMCLADESYDLTGFSC